MKRLAASLKKVLRNAGRVAVVGIGSRMRGDDAAGLLVADLMKKRAKRAKYAKRAKRVVCRSGKFKVFLGGTAPENITGEIKRFRPGHILLVDAADFKKKPGTVRLVRPEEAAGVCFCTHQIPLQVMANYLLRSIGCCVTIIGIQARTLNFGSPLSPEVEKAAEDLGKTLNSIFACKGR